jgi:orotidine-5'-phosphate decarboxylase
MQAKDRVIVALDVDNLDRAFELIDILSPEVGVFKIGIAPFTGFGQALLEKLKSLGRKVFLDLKFHDIPNTVRNAACTAAKKGVFMMNFHCLGGLRMMEAASRGVKGLEGESPILLGVTILTSMDEEDMMSIGLTGDVQTKVVELAKLAARAGLNGVVASAKEARAIRENLGEGFVIVTPGVRPTWAAAGDQKRVLTPKQAIAEGADYIVVGRPIIQADDPVEAARKIVEEVM